LAFAADQDGFVGPVDIVDVEAGKLGVADAAAVEDFEDGAVAGGPTGSFFVDGVDGVVHLLDGGDAGQVLGQARGGDEGGGVLLDVAGAGQPAEPAADGGQGAGGGGFGEAAGVEGG
jgi:hypothetical protein